MTESEKTRESLKGREQQMTKYLEIKNALIDLIPQTQFSPYWNDAGVERQSDSLRTKLEAKEQTTRCNGNGQRQQTLGPLVRAHVHALHQHKLHPVNREHRSVRTNRMTFCWIVVANGYSNMYGNPNSQRCTVNFDDTKVSQVIAAV